VSGFPVDRRLRATGRHRGSGRITLAWSTAEEAGFLVVHVSDPMVMLTEPGIQAARQKS
jgi:hypothetical protein